MMRTKSIAAGLSALLVIGSTLALAAVPQRITYQGNLRQAGILVTGTQSMLFRLYASSTSVTPLWTSAPYNVFVATGVFRVVLTPGGVDWEGNNPWLETSVAGITLAPREELTTTPYSIDALLHSGKAYASAASAPASPNAGDLWFDTGNLVLKFWNGSAWVSTAGTGISDWTAAGGVLWPANPANYVVVPATLTVSGQDAAGYSLKLSSGLTASAGTITANMFVGNGAGLTGISSADASRVLKAGDTMTGQLTTLSTITVQGSAFSVGGSDFAVNAGRVGVGTNSPSANLELKGPSGADLGLDVSGPVTQIKSNGSVLVRIKP